MNKAGIDSVVNDRVKINVNDTAKGLSLVFDGNIDMEDPSGLLDPLFEKVHTGATTQALAEIEVDFSKLQFLNSSGIKAIAKWVMKLATLPADKKYVIKIKHDKAITWQATSLPTLTFLVPGSIQMV